MGIYTTYIALNALTPVGVPDGIRQRVEVSICPEDGVVDRNCFDEAQQFVYGIVEKRYHAHFLRSSYLCRYQLELVSSGGLCLLDFLLGGDSLVYFMEFMEAESVLPLVQFWLTAESFHTNIAAAPLTSSGRQCNLEQNLEDAISIYERYFSLQATEPLDMGDEVRVDIESKICDENGPRADSYVAAQLIAYDTMNEKYYPHFLESGIYLKFLDSLLCGIRSTPDRSQPPDPAAETTEASESGRTERETVHYLAAWDVDDPESLWRQPQLLMRLGCVDSMGQYCSEIDPFPSKTTKSRGKPIYPNSPGCVKEFPLTTLAFVQSTVAS
jgi:A-kinase anchor protein 10